LYALFRLSGALHLPVDEVALIADPLHRYHMEFYAFAGCDEAQFRLGFDLNSLLSVSIRSRRGLRQRRRGWQILRLRITSEDDFAGFTSQASAKIGGEDQWPVQRGGDGIIAK